MGKIGKISMPCGANEEKNFGRVRYVLKKNIKCSQGSCGNYTTKRGNKKKNIFRRVGISGDILKY